MSEQIRVAAVDDHPIFLGGLEKVLRRMRDIAFVAKGNSAEDACRIAREHHPDVMLIDVTMPGGGLNATRTIVSSNRAVKVIMLTASDDDEGVAEAISSGAHGYLLKGSVGSEILQAIKTVRSGQPYITPATSARMLMQQVKGQGKPVNFGQGGSKINHREGEILDLLCEGLSNLEIARRLDLAEPTVKNYLSRIFDKMQVRSRTQAITVWMRTKSAQDCPAK